MRNDVNTLSRKEYLDWKRNALALLVEWIPEAIRTAFDKTPMVPIWGDTLDFAKDRMKMALEGELSKIKVLSEDEDKRPYRRTGPRHKGRSFKKTKH